MVLLQHNSVFLALSVDKDIGDAGNSNQLDRIIMDK
jgi:hypothetical protein